ncbi:hypothetical protein MRB53_017625 [Persea americana]|uniref:Uncharacterized protein n=1 Tax=Persea americana TaxID=3435 RepID=A0ACC2M577_PERAE|nr:hypothetical protein MRB53_017625 [Persea americana]
MPSDVERSSEIKTLALFDTHEAGRTLPARTHVPSASGSAIYQVRSSDINAARWHFEGSRYATSSKYNRRRRSRSEAMAAIRGRMR